MPENKELNETQEDEVVGGSVKEYLNQPVPKPVIDHFAICPKCGKSFDLFATTIFGGGGYCKDCQEKYPEELPRNKDPKRFKKMM